MAKSKGRSQYVNRLKKILLEKYGAKCHLYGELYPAKLLQPDHRIPYEIGGDPEDILNPDFFMLLSPSANRDKSWECEHCVNWNKKDINMCKKCYYAYPENYQHIAGRQERKLNLVFNENDIEIYNKLVEQAKVDQIPYQTAAKRIIEYWQQLKGATDK